MDFFSLSSTVWIYEIAPKKPYLKQLDYNKISFFSASKGAVATVINKGIVILKNNEGKQQKPHSISIFSKCFPEDPS